MATVIKANGHCWKRAVVYVGAVRIGCANTQIGLDRQLAKAASRYPGKSPEVSFFGKINSHPEKWLKS